MIIYKGKVWLDKVIVGFIIIAGIGYVCAVVGFLVLCVSLTWILAFCLDRRFRRKVINKLTRRMKRWVKKKKLLWIK